MIFNKIPLLILLLALSLTSCSSDLPEAVATAYQQLSKEIDFNYHVRPILSDHCFPCHGHVVKAILS